MNYNFGAGPSMLPHEVMQEIHDEWFDWRGTGLSAIEWSHRDPRFEPMIHETTRLIAELLNVPDTYQVLFAQGGASLMWSILPMNLAWHKKIGYAISGIWSEKAYKEGKNYSQAVIVGDATESSDGKKLWRRNPDPSQWVMNNADADSAEDLSYVHYCSNETIQGIQVPETPKQPVIAGKAPIPLIADMSSDILSRPFDINPFAAIYAGAQKNIGIAGLTLLIIRKDWLDRQPTVADPKSPFVVPATLNVRNIADNQSLLNTPCTFAIYVCHKMATWLKNKGGVGAALQRNQEKAALLYHYLDQSTFYEPMIPAPHRSLMNITFLIKTPFKPETLHPLFVQEASQAGLFQLKGHRLQGGLRASLYNAMPIEGVHALIDFMDRFAAKHRS